MLGHGEQERARGRAAWMLRMGLAGSALAAAWSNWAHYSAVNSLLYTHLGMSEELTRGLDLTAAGGLLLAALAAFALREAATRWCTVMIGLAALWFALESFAHVTLGGRVLAELAPLGESVRIVAPLALLALLRGRLARAQLALRLALAATFAAHGMEALAGVPSFVDYLLLSARHVGLTPTEDHARSILEVIGLVDLLVAALVLLRPWRGVAAYMACWGAVTLASRVSAGGLEQWPEALLRLSNAAAPAALFFLWSRGARCAQTQRP